MCKNQGTLKKLCQWALHKARIDTLLDFLIAFELRRKWNATRKSQVHKHKDVSHKADIFIELSSYDILKDKTLLH